MGNFEKALAYVLTNEGGFVDRPEDKGGPTKYGITLLALTRFRDTAVSLSEMKALTEEQAGEVYRFQFWEPLKLDQISDPGKATAMFDVAVNRGGYRAIVFAQLACLGCLPICRDLLDVDGKIGPLTLRLINTASQSEFLRFYTTSLVAGYLQICATGKSQRPFLTGWLARADRIAKELIK